MLIEQKTARYKLFAGIRRHGIDAGQVGDERTGFAADAAVLAVDGDAGEIADVLVRAGQLIEQRSLAAVLIAGEGKGQCSAFGQGIFGLLFVKAAALAQTGMRHRRAPFRRRQRNRVADVFDLDLFCVRQAQRELVAVDAQLHRVAHRSELDHRHIAVGNKTHIKKMLPQCAFAANRADGCSLADGQVFECHTGYLFLSYPGMQRRTCTAVENSIALSQTDSKEQNGKRQKKCKRTQKPLHPDAGRSGKAQLFSAGAEKRASIRLNSRQKTSANSTPNTF